MKKITSINNPYIKEVLKLNQKKYRDKAKAYLIEGYHLVFEALKEGVLKEVFITNEKDKIYGVINTLCNEEVISKLSQTSSPQNIVGIVNYFENKDYPINRCLLLDDINDPGNLGTLIRSALGFNIDTIVMSPNCVDLYNDKVVRASQGAIFRLNFITKDLNEAIEQLKAEKIKVIGTSLNKAIPLKELKIVDKYAILLGNEAHGVNEKLLELCDQNVKIEIDERLESLNVAIAGAIIMYYLNN